MTDYLGLDKRSAADKSIGGRTSTVQNHPEIKTLHSVAQNLDKSFKTKSKLKSHKIQKERYTCEMCGEIFRKEKYLLKCAIVHLRQITNDQR